MQDIAKANAAVKSYDKDGVGTGFPEDTLIGKTAKRLAEAKQIKPKKASDLERWAAIQDYLSELKQNGK